ncbi:MAG TPA: DoxX family protein [Puia sp.]|nr:DoxX family protein [Puia sp.]
MYQSLAQLYLRLALGTAYTFFGLDRLGAWGPYGKPWVSWGDWSHFSTHAHHLMFFLPFGLAEAFAVIATLLEITCGLLLLAGFLTRWAAFTSSGLALCFALAMSIADGITSPLGYSVFTVSAASLLLALQPGYRWSIDSLRTKNPIFTT